MPRKSKVVSFTIWGGHVVTIDECDADLANVSWEPHKSGRNIYARRRQLKPEKRWVRMHRVILERKLGRAITDGMITDHIDRNTLNNCRHNLREVTHSENLRNRRAAITNQSGIKGVTWHKRDKIWQAHVCHDGVLYYLGRFKSKDLAYLAVVKKRMVLGIADHQ